MSPNVSTAKYVEESQQVYQLENTRPNKLDWLSEEYVMMQVYG